MNLSIPFFIYIGEINFKFNLRGGEDMDDFSRFLHECYDALERFVKFKVENKTDAEDIIQDTCLAAYTNFESLINKMSFKAWIISIARNKCSEYYRKKAAQMDIPLESLSESVLTKGIHGITETTAVRETLELLNDKDKQILFLYYFKSMPQNEIAHRLGLPAGTVKSRLYHAKQNFKEKYPYSPKTKGDHNMKTMPAVMPEYRITKSEEKPFSVRWEEVMGWFIVPKLGEKLSWAMYEFPSRRRTEMCQMEVVGKAEVHGIEGVEIVSTEYEPMEYNSAGGQKEVERHFIAQLTDTHCRLLAESHTESGIKKYYTFLDGNDFLANWGFGEDNCGNEVNIVPKGEIMRDENVLTTVEKPFLLDVVGRYTVTIGGKKYDTICVVDFGSYQSGAVSEQFIDRHGKTVLWRRFNRNDWAFHRYQQKWTDRLPDNERLSVNGETYVHWYDCITDYIL